MATSPTTGPATPINIRCARCGVESAERSCFFVPERHGKPPHYIRCITCEQRRLQTTVRRGFAGVLTVTLWPILILAVVAHLPNSWYLLCSSLLYPLAVVAHELGHALTARILGLEVGAITIGYGHTPWRFEVASIPVRIHALPLSGSVLLGSRSLQFLRTRLWIATLMGPMTNALLIAALVHWWGSLEQRFGAVLPALFLAINFLVVTGNLIPRYIPRLGRRLRSDGLALVQIPRTPVSKLHRYLFAALQMRAHSRFEAGDVKGAKEDLTQALQRVPGEPSLTLGQAACFYYLGQYTAARSVLTSLLEGAAAQGPHFQAAVRSSLAFTLLMEDPDAGAESPSLRQADKLSAESFEMYPCILAFRSTRSLVLSAVGRCDEATHLLDHVLYAHASRQERSHQEASRAFALRKSGRLREARAIAERAAGLDRTTLTFLVTFGLSAA